MLMHCSQIERWMGTVFFFFFNCWQRKDTTEIQSLFKNVLPGNSYLNVTAGRSAGSIAAPQLCALFVGSALKGRKVGKDGKNPSFPSFVCISLKGA